jgi:hypothetical protein
MARTFRLCGSFLSVAIASSLLVWLASLHPSLLRPVVFFYGVLVIAVGVAVILDDPIAASLQVTDQTIHAWIIGILTALVVGAGVTAICLRF